jgi:F420-0:gamma-glutamyl ligase
MVEPYPTDSEFKNFVERMKATYDLAKKHGIKLTNPENIDAYNPLDVILALYTERLDKSSKRLKDLLGH